MQAVSSNITLADLFLNLGVTHIINYPDRDQAGLNKAIRTRDSVMGAPICFEARELPYALGSKADVNRLLLDTSPAELAAALEQCPVLILPEPIQPTEKVAGQTVPFSDAASDSYERWCSEIEQAAIRTWNIAPAKANGWSAKNFSSPLREDRKPSAAWNYSTHGFKDFGTGEFYNTAAVADLLGLPAWEVYSHALPKQTGQHPRRKTTFEETIQPVVLPDFQAHQTVTMRYISNLAVDDVLAHRAVLIKSPVGTGKTELVKRVIADLDQQETANVLVITHRQALAADIAARLGLECYKTIPDTMLPQAHRLVITYNSLHKIGTRRQWDLVVIDEIEQFHQHLFSDTFRGGEAYRAYQALTSVLQQTRHFMGLDAHLTDISAQWTHHATRIAPYIIQNNYRHDWGDLTLHESESSVIAAALKAAKAAHGPVVITTSSRQRSEIYYRLVCDTIGSDGVLLVNGENSSSAEIQRFIDHINEDLTKLRVLINTPSFGTGLDVTAPVYGVFGVMLNRPLIATDMIQMLGRFRNAQARHVYIQPLHQGEPRDWINRWSETLDAAAETRTRANFSQYGIAPTTTTQREVLLLAAKLATAADQQKTDLVSYFAGYAHAEGFKLVVRHGHHILTRTAIRATGETLAEERKTRVLAALSVDHTTYEQHQQMGTLTPDIIAGYERWKIENVVGLAITDNLYDDLHTPANRTALRRLTDVLADTEQLEQCDRDEASEQVLLTHRGHYTTTQELITGVLTVVFGADRLESSTELTERNIRDRLNPFLADHLAQIQRLLDRRDDLSLDPMFVLRRVLKRIGLKLSRRQIMHRGTRFMVYGLDKDTRDRWLTYARARLAHLARLETLTANPEGSHSLRVRRSGTPKPQVGRDFEGSEGGVTQEPGDMAPNGS